MSVFVKLWPFRGLFPSYHVYIRNWSKAGNKYVCFHLSDATCKRVDQPWKEYDINQDAFEICVEESEVSPTSWSRSQSIVVPIQQSIQDACNVVRVNFLISADITKPERIENKTNIQKVDFLSFFLTMEHSP